MSDRRGNPTFGRLLRDDAVRAAFEVLATKLPGTDATSLLLEVFQQRAANRSAADLMRQYSSDRFVAPGAVDACAMGRIELNALEAASESGFVPIVLAPVAPLGTHSVLGSVPQNNVVSTVRMSEVTADPTNSMALEAAVRRSQALEIDARSPERVRLAGHHRVVRAQRFEGPRSFAHFSLFGLVTAGRDSGNFAFEQDALVDQIAVLVDIIKAVVEGPVRVLVSAFTRHAESHCIDLRDRVRGREISCELWPEREQGRGYYDNFCFKLVVEVDGEECEVGDGGDVSWTQALLANNKERITIAGLGLERLAMLAPRV